MNYLSDILRNVYGVITDMQPKAGKQEGGLAEGGSRGMSGQ